MSERRAPDAFRRPSGPELVVSHEEERELQAVVRLLQQLPDPELPDGMGDRILQAVSEQEARANRGFRRAAPWAGTALAAGLAALAVFTTIADLPLSPSPDHELTPTFARPVTSATTTDAREGEVRRSTLPVIAPVVVAERRPRLLGPMPSGELPGLDGRPMTLDAARLLERRLDHEINHLLLAPVAFFDNLARRRDRDRLVAQIAERAAERGDAVEVALRLRQLTPRHPIGMNMAEALLRSVGDQYSKR